MKAPAPGADRSWCIHRDGDLCTHPESPVNRDARIRKPINILDRLLLKDEQGFYAAGECGPVCTGEVACGVREVQPGDLLAYVPDETGGVRGGQEELAL